MNSSIKVALLALTVAACGEPKRIAVSIPIPAERMDCVEAGNRPAIPPELVIDWSQITTVLAAQEAHKAFVARVRTREGIVAGYLLKVEGQLFACSNDAQWLREWQAGIQ